MENSEADLPELEPVPRRDRPREKDADPVPETLKARAVDFILKKFCSEEKKKTAEYNAWKRAHDYGTIFEYDEDADYQSIKEQQKAYDTAKQSGFVPHTFGVLCDAEKLAMLLLHTSARSFHRSKRAAEQERKQLRWFEESPEFKDLVPSALSRVKD
jgi:hypothetical protein